MRLTAAAVSAVFVAGPALADLTAEDVLADQLNLLSGYGVLEMETLDTTVTSQGLSVKGFRGTYRDKEEDVDVTVTYGGVELVEQGDGSVRVVYPEQYPISVASNVDEGPDKVTVTLELLDVDHVVSGGRDNLQHDVDAGRIAFARLDGVPEEDLQDLNFAFVVENLDSTLRFADEDAAQRDLRFVIGAMQLAISGNLETEATDDSTTELEVLDVAISLTNAEGAIGHVDGDVPRHQMDTRFAQLDWKQMMSVENDGDIDFELVATDVGLSYDIALSIEALEDSFVDALNSGQYGRGQMHYGASETTMNMELPDGSFQMISNSGVAEAAFSLSSTGFALSTSAADLEFEILGPDNPALPFSTAGYEARSVGYGFSMPMLESDQPQPFGFDMSLTGLTVSETLWDLFDPGQRIPRDPIDLTIDLSGTTVVTEDPFTAEDGVVPFANTEASLNVLRLAAAGAVLTGEGSIIDKSTPEKPSGVGKLSAMLIGGNTLLDTLVDMGLVDTNQAMAARMMLGVVARPGDGPDTLVSKIEVNEDGHIFANGQRIK